ncbi:helix-turn-helix transcriptional regulator [Olivibacter sp. CPCC 100613]|uniref:helix-turn-helix domain-containing protein n=1 Tax=Olivibacter sp. CPCC 100613 TaxID=3079931 RepID=UPI002FFBB912
MTNTELLYLIKSHRKAKGLSQGEMANRLNIVLKTYQNIESGITRLDIERLKQIANLIDLNLSTVFNRSTDVISEKNTEKELYNKLLIEKETYITKLENDIKFYQEILRDNKHFL